MLAGLAAYGCCCLERAEDLVRAGHIYLPAETCKDSNNDYICAGLRFCEGVIVFLHCARVQSLVDQFIWNVCSEVQGSGEYLRR